MIERGRFGFFTFLAESRRLARLDVAKLFIDLFVIDIIHRKDLGCDSFLVF